MLTHYRASSILAVPTLHPSARIGSHDMGNWWTEKAGSKPNRKPARVKIDRKDKCGICGKATCRCTRTDVTQNKGKVVVTDKNNRNRTVTKNLPSKRDSHGNDWCTACSCRVMNGRCTNVTCSTRK